MRAMHAQKFCFLNKVGTRNPHKQVHSAFTTNFL